MLLSIVKAAYCQPSGLQPPQREAELELKDIFSLTVTSDSVAEHVCYDAPREALLRVQMEQN